MKIDIGNGKILGTKKVSPNGQISGFSEYAGKEVLVILPEEEPRIQPSPEERLREVQGAVLEQMKSAFARYKELKKRFETPERATREFVERYAPKSVQGLFERVEEFAKNALREAEGRVEESLSKTGEPPQSQGSPPATPNP